MNTTIRIFRINLIMFFIFCMFFTPGANAQLSGTYTINPSGGGLPNFISFDAAVSALTSQGVSGPVVINIVPGTYIVHTIIPQITGASSVNTITFQSSTVDSTLVTLSYTYTNSLEDNYMIKLDGADFITFKSMTFNSYDGDPGYGTIFHITGGANNNKFLKNAFYGKSGYSSNYNNLIYSSETDDENNIFEKNLLFYGYTAIMLSGVSSANLVAGTVIRNNVFREQTGSSVWLKFQNAPLIEDNKIEILNGENGIYLEEVNWKYQILDNTIKIGQPNGAINIYSSNGLIGANGLIANNMVTVNTGNYENETCAGIRIYNSSYLQVYHNSILATSGTNTKSSSLYQYGGSNIDIRNNILANFSSGYAYSVSDAVNISDYNNYYTTGKYLARWEYIDKEDLEGLISASSGDQHSVSVNPVFNSDNDLHTTTFRLENKGTNLLSVISVDFDGEPRSVSPDIGADEFITGTGSALSGEYFIGGSSPDFVSITQAVQQMNKYGILSSVIFNIRDDNSPYRAQINILPVTGASEINTITFRPDPTNTKDAIISFNAEDYNAIYTLEMKRVSYVKINDLTLMAENDSYGTVISINGLCHHDSITGCTIISTSPGGNNHGIFSYGGLLKNIYITGNKFTNGYSGIYLSGSYEDIKQDVEILENDFSGNSYGIRISGGSNSLKILKNSIKCTGQGIEISDFTGSPIYKGLIANNFINMKESNYNTVGLYLRYASYLQIYFNTVKIGEQNIQEDSKAFSVEGGSNIDVQNNIFCNFGKGYAYHIGYSVSFEQSDYNALFTAGNYISYYNENLKELADLQSVSSNDVHSLDAHPAFVSEDEVHINSPFLDGSGIAIPGLISDIDDETRSTPPDIGADEYTSSVTSIPGGTYKIGGITPDYNTIKQAFDDLQIRGISGPVILEIRKGQYNEFIGSVFKITGTSKTDTIILRSESGNPEDVIIYYETSYNNENIFHFKGVDHFTLSGLSISSTGTSYGRLIKISGSSDNISIIHNELISSLSYYSDISIDALTNQLLIRDNLISGGGISFDNYSEGTDTRITGNIISGGGILFNGNSKGTDTWIIGNRITETDQSAIKLYNQIKPMIIGNTILASGGQGIYLSNCINNFPFYGVIANNMIQVGGDGNAYGLYLDYWNKRMYIFNNSINITNNNYYSSYGIYVEQYSADPDEIRILNNIVSNSSGDWVMYVNDANDITESDYNNFFTTGTNFVDWGGTEYENLTTLRLASGMENHSLSLDPLFYTQTDLHSAQAAFHKAGTPLADVPYDIDSIHRDPVKPDIGAVEFTCGTPVFNVFVSPTCLGDTTILIDKSTNVVPGSTYGWDFDADLVPDAGYSSTKPGYTIKYYFNNPGVHYVNYIISQIGGCMDYTSVEIPVNNPPVLDIITTGAYCGVDDGEAVANVTEGVRPFKYFWSNGETDSIASNLAMGTYTLAVSDAAGCASDAEFTIENAIQVTVTQLKPSTCGIEDGSAEVTARGGNKPYTYAWSDGGTSRWNNTLSPGRHYINVIDAHNCYSQGFVDIKNEGGPQVTLERIENNKCYGEQNGSIDISITGAYSSILWSNGATSEDITNLATGIYDVLATTVDGCMGAGSFEVIQPAQLQISSIVENASCSGSDGKAMAVVSGGTKPYTYKWSPSGDIYQIEEDIPAGIYSVTVRDANACMAKIPVIVNSIGGPVVTINSITGTGCSDTTNGAIDIGITGGTPLYSFAWLPDGQTTPDISGLSPGTYEIRVTDQAGCIGVNTAVVEKALPAVNPICLVTVDTITGKNMIVWEKLNTTDVDHYIIYRESSSKNIYQPVGTRPVDSLSIFIDSVADPMLRSWRYKLSVADVCGNESPLSDHHKTMHLTMNLGLNSTVNLIWDHYEGFEVNTYEVYRYDAQTASRNIANIPANLTSYTDMTPPVEGVTYYIETMRPAGCLVTDLKGSTLNSSRSNRQSKLKITGFPLNYFAALNLVIWPNPGNGIYNLSMENVSSENIMLKVYDITGKLIYINEYLNLNATFVTSLNLSSFANGIYHLHLQTGNNIFHRVLIKE